MDELVTIKTFTYAHEAGIARNILESNDIFCFLKDELTIQANPFYSNALGGVKLQVRSEDAEYAIEVLKEYGLFETETTKTIRVENESGLISECPRCKAEDLSIIKKPSGVLFAISFFLLGFPLPYFSTVYHCYNCGTDIKVSRARKGAKDLN